MLLMHGNFAIIFGCGSCSLVAWLFLTCVHLPVWPLIMLSILQGKNKIETVKLNVKQEK